MPLCLKEGRMAKGGRLSLHFPETQFAASPVSRTYVGELLHFLNIFSTTDKPLCCFYKIQPYVVLEMQLHQGYLRITPN